MPRQGEVVKVHLADPYRVWPALCGTFLVGADQAGRLTRKLEEVTCQRCRRIHDAQDLGELEALRR